MTDKSVTEGQVFNADDGGIKVTVIPVGNSEQRARFKIENLKEEKARYIVFVQRRSGTDPDRIDYETDDPRTGEFELSADETTGIEIKLIR